MNDERLRAELQKLADAGITPERDLWPELKRRLRARRLRRWRPALVAAAVAASIAFFAAWGLRHTQQVEFPQRELSALPASSSPALQSAFADYLEQRQGLLRTVARELAAYPPEVQAEVWKSIELIERAMHDLEATLSAANGAGETEARLASLYERELALLGVVSARLRGAAGGFEG